MVNPRELISELRRRRVFSVVGVYAVLAYGAVEAASLFVPALGLPPGVVTVVAVAALAGFPVVLALGWVYDLTLKGVHRTPDRPAAPAAPAAPTGSSGREGAASAARLVAAGMGVGILVAVVALGAISRGPALVGGGGAGGGAGGPVHAIAVLPFADRSVAGGDAYFSDGLTEELLNALGRRGGVRVASRSSSFRYRGDGVDVREVGRALGVEAVLEGSVQRDGDRLRVTAQLTDVNTGYTLWAEAYDRALTDVFEVQEELARRILSALDLPPTTGEPVVRARTASLEAYDHFLRGNYLLGRRTLEDVLRAIEEYGRAAAIDPGFAAALHRQGYAHALIADWGWHVAGLTRQEVIDRGARLVDRALARDAESAEAWLARAYLRVVQDPYRMDGAAEAFERAVALAPDDPEVLHQYGQALTALGRHDRALSLYERTLELEPDRSMTMVTVGAIHGTRGELGEALRWADSAVAVGPANTYARAYRAMVAMLVGDTAGALEDARLASRLDGAAHAVPVQGALAYVLASAGDTAAALRAYQSARGLASGDVVSATDGLYLTIAAQALGRTGEALSFAEAAEPRGAWLWFYFQGPLLDPLRDEPRFRAVVDAADPRG